MHRHHPQFGARFISSALLTLLFLGGVFLFSLTPHTEAATNRLLPFSARLTAASSDGPAPDGNYDITFAIYDSETGGTPLWTETQTLGVTNGIVSAILGETTPFPPTLNFEAGPYYFGIRVGSDDEMAPRKKVAAVPLAFNANTVGGLSAGTGANNVLALDGAGAININGSIATTSDLQGGSLTTVGALTVGGTANLGSGLQVTGSTSIGGALTVGGNISVAGNLIPTTGGTYDLGTASNPFNSLYVSNLVAGSTSTAGTTSSSFTLNQNATGDADSALNFYRGGSLTTAQLLWNATSGRFELNQALSVAGSLNTPLLTGGRNANQALTLQGNSASSGNTATNVAIQLKVGDAGGTTAMTILNNGKIGVGTTSPAALFSVATNGGSYVNVDPGVLDVGYNTSSRVQLVQNIGAWGDVGAGSSGGIRIQGGFSGIYSYIAGSGSSLVLNGLTGNVGVQTTAPIGNFQVSQSTRGIGTVRTFGTTTLTGTSTQFTNTFKVGDTITVSGDTRTITGISDDTHLTVDTAFSTSSTGLAYTLVGGNRFMVMGNGNVGIGTANPEASLTIDRTTSGDLLNLTDSSSDSTSRFKFSNASGSPTLEIGARGSGTLSALKVGGQSSGINGVALTKFDNIYGIGPTGSATTISLGSTMQPAAVNSYDLGTSGRTFRTGYFATSLLSPSLIGSSSANAVLTLQGNSASTGNTVTNVGIQFKVGDSGGTTAMTILNNGKVGIGNSAPRANLEIESSTPRLYLTANSTNYLEMGFLSGRATINAYDSATGNGSGLVLQGDSGGNVGIGATSPAASLDILNSSSTSGLAFQAVTTLQQATGDEAAFKLNYTVNKATSGNDSGLVVNMTDTSSPGNTKLIDLQVGGVSKFSVNELGAVTAASGGSFSGTLNGNLVYASTRFIALSNNLQFGTYTVGPTIANTSSQLVGLNVSPTLNQASGSAANVMSQIAPIYNQVGTQSNVDFLINRTETAVGSGAQYLLDAQVGGVSRFNIKNTGAVGVGVADASAKIHVLSTTEQLRLGYDASNYSSFTVSSAGALTLQNTVSNQNIAINTTGSGRVTTNIGLTAPNLQNSSNKWFLSINTWAQSKDNTITWNDNAFYHVGTVDLGIARSSAGTLEVNNGTAGTLRDIRARALLGDSTANSLLTLQGNTATGNTATNAGIQFKVGDSGGTTAMSILNNGNIGIGTTDSYGKLNVQGTIVTTSEGDIFSQRDTGDNATYPVFARYNSNNGTYPASTFIFGSGTNPTVGIEKPGNASVTRFQVRAVDSIFLGRVGIGAVSAGPQLSVTGTSDNIQLLVKANGTQTANIIEVQDSTGVVLAKVNQNGALTVKGISTSLTTKTADYTLTDSDSIITGDASGGAIVLTLPTAVGISGRQYTIKKTDATGNTVTVATTSGQTIDGTTPNVLSAQYKYVTIVSDGANWIITANN